MSNGRLAKGLISVIEEMDELISTKGKVNGMVFQAFLNDYVPAS